MFLQTCKRLNFPQESLEVLAGAYRTIMEDPQTAQELNAACESLMKPGCNEYLKIMSAIAEKTGVNPYTADMVLMIVAIEPLKEAYAQRGLPEQLMWESMEDLRYKLLECKALYNVWGTFIAFWLKIFYVLRCFKFGRLEFEQRPHFSNVTYGGIHRGDPTVLIHIPSDGPLHMGAVMDSLRQAYGFYKDQFPNGIVPFITNSWLLYPPLLEQVFPANSNVQKFASLFHIIEANPDEENGDFYRVFDCEYKKADLNDLPQKTALQRNLQDYLLRGNCMGWGYGIFLYGKNGIVDWHVNAETEANA